VGRLALVVVLIAGCRIDFDELGDAGAGSADGMPATNTIALVHDSGYQVSTNATSLDVTIGAVVPGNALVATISSNHNGAITAISGGGVTWSQAVTAQNGPDERLYIYYGTQASGGATSVAITFDIQDNFAADITEWSGLAATGTLDGSGSLPAGTGTTASSGTVTTSHANDLMMTLVTDETGTLPAAGPTNGYTALSSGTLHELHQSAYRIVTTTGVQSTTYTFAPGDQPWTGIIAAFAGG
jgi:hypothetical protein